jgi:hypothetical protein
MLYDCREFAIFRMKQQHTDKLSIRFFIYAKTGHFFNDLKGVENFGVMHRLLEDIEAAGDIVVVQIDEDIPLIAFRYTSDKAFDQRHGNVLRAGSLLDHGVGAPFLKALQDPHRKPRLRAGGFKLPHFAS